MTSRGTMDTIFTVVQEGRGSSPQPPCLGTGTLPLYHQPAARPAGPIIKMSPFSPNGGDSLVSLHFISDQLDTFFIFFYVVVLWCPRTSRCSHFVRVFKHRLPSTCTASRLKIDLRRCAVASTPLKTKRFCTHS